MLPVGVPTGDGIVTRTRPTSPSTIFLALRLSCVVAGSTVSVAVSLLAALPELLDLYTPTTGGLGGRLFGWPVVLPTGMGAAAVGAGLCPVVFFRTQSGGPAVGVPAAAGERLRGATPPREASVSILEVHPADESLESVFSYLVQG